MLYIRQVRVQSPGTMSQHITEVRYAESTIGPVKAATRDAVVRAIELGSPFRTHNERTRAEAPVTIRTSAAGTKYITTIADGRETNNLLELPRY